MENEVNTYFKKEIRNCEYEALREEKIYRYDYANKLFTELITFTTAFFKKLAIVIECRTASATSARANPIHFYSSSRPTEKHLSTNGKCSHHFLPYFPRSLRKAVRSSLVLKQYSSSVIALVKRVGLI